MTINGSTNSSAWTYKLEATETATSTTNRTSTVQVKAYIGRANSQSYLGGNYSVSVTCAGQTSTQSGNISYPTYINGGAWLLLKTFTFTVSNTGNPTTINISSSFSSSDFTPSSASASGSMNLTILHLPPTISSINLQELNTEVSNAGVLGYHIVQYLSRKKFTVNAVYNDGASLSTFKIYHNNVLIGSSSTNEITIDFENVGTLKTVRPGDYLMVPLVFEIKDNQNGTATQTNAYRIVQYTPPSLEATSTNIKRKSGNGVNLVDNKATLNLVGVIYKNTIDGIGQNNAVTSAGYKIWEQNTSEPGNYTSLTTTTDSSGNVTVSNIEISNIDFRKTYNYKIMFADSFKKANNQYHSDITTGTIPLGQPTWTEYKDRIDVIKLTVGGYNPFEYSEDETICGIWNDGLTEKTIYRKVLNIGSLPNSSSSTVAHGISNIDKIISLKGVAIRSSDKDTLPIPYVTFNANNNGGIIIYADSTNVKVTTSTNRSSYNGYIILEYTKN